MFLIANIQKHFVLNKKNVPLPHKQLSLGFSDTGTIKSFRTIHYLGSKLRLLNIIKEAVNKVDPSFGRVYDLFAGSGSVSYFLSGDRPVTSVDIQNYSNVLCTTLLDPVIPTMKFLSSFTERCLEANHSKTLEWAVSDLTKYEEEAIFKALHSNNPDQLCDIIENGSLISFETTNSTDVSGFLKKLIKDSLDKLNSKEILNFESLSIRYFGGIYFSYKQSAQIDSILYQIFNSPVKYRNFLMSALLSTVSDSVNTVGKQFAQPIRPRNSKGRIKSNLGKIAFRDRTIDIIYLYEDWIKKYSTIEEPRFNHTVLKTDYLEALNHISDDTKVIYADPPYTRDHYSRFYHVLETISLRDTPAISRIKQNGKTVLSRGLYREDRHQSPFCIKSEAPLAFKNLFEKISSAGISFILSYSPFDKNINSHPRVVDLDFLIQLANEHFNEVSLISPDKFIHNKLNRSDKHLKASKKAEILILCKKN